MTERIGIRARVTLIAVSAIFVVLVLTAWALLAGHRRLLTDAVDETLTSRSEEIGVLVAADSVPPVLSGQGDLDSVAQVVSTDGDVIATSANFVGQPALPEPPAGSAAFRIVRLPVDESAMRIYSRRQGSVVIHTATPIDDVDESVDALRRGLLLTIPLALVVLGLVLWRTVGRALSPVERIRERAGEITATNLHLRVPEPGGNDEIGRLAATMNDMLDRLERSGERQRRFVADASHELRSPLARIRTELEVDLTHPDRSDGLATHRSVLVETEHLQRIIDDLLVLARLDASIDRAASGWRAVDLDDVVQGEVGRRRAEIAATAELEIDTTGIGAVQVIGHPDHLRRAVRNLVDNACRHAASAITITLREHDGWAELRIADDGTGVAPADRQRIFERFARLDEARSADAGGTGLGLAITREIAESHGGTVDVEQSEPRGATFLLRLPIGDP